MEHLGVHRRKSIVYKEFSLYSIIAIHQVKYMWKHCSWMNWQARNKAEGREVLAFQHEGPVVSLQNNDQWGRRSTERNRRGGSSQTWHPSASISRSRMWKPRASFLQCMAHVDLRRSWTKTGTPNPIFPWSFIKKLGFRQWKITLKTTTKILRDLSF